MADPKAKLWSIRRWPLASPTVADSRMAESGGNAYEALREAKIARNQARLKELGLLHYKLPSDSPAPAAKAKRPLVKQSLPTEVRRSKRVRKEPVLFTGLSDDFQEPLDVAGRESRGRNKPARKIDPTTLQALDLSRSLAGSQQVTPDSVARVATSTSGNSAKTMELNVDKLIDSLLGQTLASTGKAAVMEESARIACPTYTGGAISFNKYSGVQDWASSLFLWVNLGAPDADVVNEFLDSGRAVTWFGGARMSDTTSVIQKLQRVGTSGHTRGSVILWCRRYQPERKTCDPYVCLGRLSVRTHACVLLQG